ncbi:unnamed protein product [Symbiodinium sp. CCMP2592]|nr:unnamed protein product [Symbiodinium sp. CCMP2592]
MPSSDRDDDELSDSARAALRIQQEIEGGVSDEAPRKTSSRSSGNGRTHGAVTGIALGEYADSPKASKASKASKEGVQIRAKGSKAGLFKESLESLAYREDSDHEVNPEAPAGSFRKKDLQQEERDRSKKARVGLDGKLYQFIDAPSDDEEHQASDANEGKQKTKKKTDTKKEKKAKKDPKKKKKKKHKKKSKKHKDSSSSSSSS